MILDFGPSFERTVRYLEKKYQVYTGASDLYVYFFEKAMSLLKENGFFAFIVSNKFLRAGYGQKLTQYLQQNFTLLNLIDFGDLQIFEGATTYPCIITMQKKKPADIQRVPLLKLTSLETVSNLGLDLKENGFLVEIKRDDASWQLKSLEQKAILQKIATDTTTLGQFVADKILYGIKTGFNEGFLIDTATKERLCKNDSSSEEVIKPILIGEDISRYEYNWQEVWVIVIPAGWTNKNRQNIDAETYIQTRYPAIYNHLKSVQATFELNSKKGNRKGLFNRDDQGDYWWELRSCAYYNSFASPKIIWGNLTTSASFSFDTKGYYINNPSCCIPTSEKWLLALLNSSVATFFLRNTAIERQGGFIEQKPVYVKQFPIPNVNHDLRIVLSEKVETLLKLNLEKQELHRQALEVIRAEYRLNKVTQKLERFLNLGWNEFVEEIEKQKIKLDLTQKDKLNVWFRSKQNEVKNISENTEKLNREIDTYIYNLFNLNDAEIKLIEKANET